MMRSADDGPRRILVIASLAWSLVNFRGRLLAEMVAAGHDVTATAPDADPAVIRALADMGIRFVPIPMQRTGVDVLADLGTLRALLSLMRSIRPDTVLAYTQKPIVYGCIAAGLAGVPHVHAMVSGLGIAFTGSGSPVLRRLVAALYRLALARAETVIVFNSDDEAEMRRHRMLPGRIRVVHVPGSGVDVFRFSSAPMPSGPPVFLLVARMMVPKGIRDFAEAARLVRMSGHPAQFRLLGPRDPGPAGLPPDELDGWQAEGLLTYLGETRDVAPHLAAASVVVLPTWYREGLPRSILEAMATGRPVITTDMPGCRDAVVHEETGLLVPPRDPIALAGAMLRLATDPALAERMGRAGRERVEAGYDVDIVNDRVLRAIGLRGDPAPTDGAGPPVIDRAPLARLLALAACLVAAPVLLPLSAIVALAVAGALGRPLLFRQQRSGLGGASFTLLKFRTMHPPAPGADPLADDAVRTPPVGAMLRRFRLDELPQCWNLLAGHMNIVGPRPLLPKTIRDHGADGVRRGAVRPGLTGWAQVNGGPELRIQDRLMLDLWYIENRSLRLDLVILLKTIRVILAGDSVDHRSVEEAHAGRAHRGG